MKSISTIITGLMSIVLPALLIGCGGGGASTNSNLQFIANWPAAVTAGSGQSIRLTDYLPNGSVGQSQIINYSGTIQSSISLTGLVAGSNHLQAQLFSQQNAQGTEIGDLDLAVDPSQTHIITVDVAGTTSSLKVTPTSAQIPVQQTVSFYANGIDPASNCTFLPLASVSWSELGGFGTIDPVSGLYTGTSAGSGSVRATASALGFSGGATVTVTSINVTKSTWTIFVFMNAANDLSQYSLTNFEQMQSIASNSNVRIVVQWKQVPTLGYPTAFDGTRRYLVQQSNAQSIASTLVQDMGQGVDMGNYQTLNQFLNWGTTYYPADHYALVMWDHGNGWNRSPSAAMSRAVSYDDETGNAIQTWQLSQGLGSNHFDILAWDASLMQMAEVSDEIRDQVTYTVGSEESPPGAGYPYNLIFGKFTQNPNDTVLDLAKGFVDGMIQGYAASNSDKITQSVLDNSKLPALMTSINNLQVALFGALGSNGFATAIQNVRSSTQTYSQTSIRYYRDLFDLTNKLDATGAMPPSVTTADAAVRTAIQNAVVYQQHNTLSPNSNGISIDFSPSSVFVSSAGDYSLLRMNTDTQWGHWLQNAP